MVRYEYFILCDYCGCDYRDINKPEELNMFTNKLVKVNNEFHEMVLTVNEDHMAKVISTKKVMAVAEKMGWLNEGKKF